MPLNQYEDEKLKNFLSPQTDQEVETESKVADSHPGHSADDLTNYVKGQEAQVDRYGPEQEKQVMDSIVKQRGSLGHGISHAGATLADALMQGVAGAGNPGFARNLDENQARMDEMRLKEPQIEQSMNAQNMGEKQKLEGMTSSTPLGASQVAPLAAFFKSVGIPETEIPKMLQNPAAARGVVEPYALMMTNQQKIQMETLLKQLELGQSGQRIKTEAEKAQAEATDKEEQRKLDATKELAKMPWYSRVLHPGVAGELTRQSGMGKDTGDLSQKFASDVVAYAQKHGISSEQANEIKIKRTGGK